MSAALAKTIADQDMTAAIKLLDRRNALWDIASRAAVRGDDATYNQAMKQFWSVPMRSDGEKRK